MTATFFLIRHAAHGHLGEVLSGRAPGLGLSDIGRRQASDLAERLRTLRFAAIATSPVQRARETTAAIAEGRDLAVTVAPAFDEVDFGAWTGKSFAALADEPGWADWNSARAITRAPGGETMAEAQVRAVAGIERLAERHAGEAVAIVSHCDVIRAVVAHYLGLDLDRLLAFDCEPASVSRIVVGPWGGRVLSVNEGAL